MTKEDAIQEVKNYDDYPNGLSTECREYIIKALEQPTMDKAMIHTLVKENEDLKAEIGILRQALEQPTSDDCVSRQAVDKLCIRYLKTPTDENVRFYEEFCSLPPVTPTQKWIPVNERYPRPEDEYKDFLVTDTNGEVSIQTFYLTIDKLEKRQPYFSGMRNVVAWQTLPLPKAYEEKRGNENE